MITNYNTYIKESNDFILKSIRDEIYSKISTEIIKICNETFNYVTHKIILDKSPTVVYNQYTKHLRLYFKDRILFNVCFYFESNNTFTINISNTSLDYIYEKNYSFIEETLTTEKLIDKVFTITIEDFNKYLHFIDKCLYDVKKYEYTNNYDKINVEKLNNLVFRKNSQDTYDFVILKFIEHDTKNIKNLDLSLCSEWVLQKIEHLKNANNFDLI